MTALALPDQAAVAVCEALRPMPAPWASPQVDALEAELGAFLDTRHVIAVSSGTAALQCALTALGVGPGDEVLVPAASVMMSVAPIVHVGAVPVFVDCDEAGTDFDYEDLARKVSDRSRSIMPVHLWGRAGHTERMRAFAAAHRLPVLEDACQAIGTTVQGRALGTFGTIGCFSLKDGKILWAGEGGFLVTSDAELAARCRAYRNHWLTPPDGEKPLARLAHNWRLSEVQAAVARWNLSRVDELLRRRREQTRLLARLLRDVPHLRFHRPGRGEDWNGYAAVAQLTLPNPREFSRRLAHIGIRNSVGTFNLTAADQRAALAPWTPAPCPRAAHLIDSTLALIVDEHDTDERLTEIAETITKEARSWAAR